MGDEITTTWRHRRTGPGGSAPGCSFCAAPRSDRNGRPRGPTLEDNASCDWSGRSANSDLTRFGRRDRGLHQDVGVW